MIDPVAIVALVFGLSGWVIAVANSGKSNHCWHCYETPKSEKTWDAQQGSRA